MSQLELSGVPTVVLCTTEFTRAADEQWQALGFADGPVVEVGHPLGSMPPEQVLAEAERAVAKVETALTRREGQADAASG